VRPVSTDPLDYLVREIKEKAEGKIIIVKIIKRTSESCYNYKTSDILVVYKPEYKSYEEADIRSIEIIEVWTGAFQEYPLATPDIIEEELAKEYVVERVRIY
jgi:hypothetical protein